MRKGARASDTLSMQLIMDMCSAADEFLMKEDKASWISFFRWFHLYRGDGAGKRERVKLMQER